MLSPSCSERASAYVGMTYRFLMMFLFLDADKTDSFSTSLMPMTHLTEIVAKKTDTNKPVPVSALGASDMQFGTEFFW